MRFFLSVLAAAWLLVAPAQAQDASVIEDVIGQQLEAFNARDVPAAWGYASPYIKRIFETPENFGRMVQQGYPMVWDNTDVRFLELREVYGNLWQRVMISDAQGGLHMLDYQMIETPQGWQINAVQLLPPPGVGA